MVKRILNRIISYTVAVLCVLLIMKIFRAESDYLLQTLYRTRSMLTVGTLYTKLVRQVVAAALLCAFGSSSFIMDILTKETKEFLSIARLCFFGAVFVFTLWDYTIIASMPLAAAYRYGFSYLGDIALVFIGAELSVLVYRTVLRERGREWLNYAFAAYCSLQIVSVKPYKNSSGLILFSIFVFAFTAYGIFRFLVNGGLYRKKWMEGMTRMIISVALPGYFIGEIIFVSRFKFETLGDGYRIYLRSSIYVCTVLIFLVFLGYIVNRQMAIRYGRETSRRLELVLERKEELENMLLVGMEPRIERLIGYTEVLRTTDAADRVRILSLVQEELAVLRTRISNVDDYRYLREIQDRSSTIRVSLEALVNYSLMLVTGHNAEAVINFSEENSRDLQGIYVYADPYLIVSTNNDLMETLTLYSAAGEVDLEVTVKGMLAAFAFTIPLKPEYAAEAKYMCKALQNPEYRRYSNDENELVAIIREKLRINGAGATARIYKENNVRKLRISYELSRCFDEAPAAPAPIVEEEKKRIVLLSTNAEQIEIMRNYLVSEPYLFRPFTAEEDALEYIMSGRPIGLVILGSVFYTSPANGFGTKIRERFSMEQLPILLITRRGTAEALPGIPNYLNDICEEPLRRQELLRKIELLISLQKSAEETSKAKIDFLQAQINPHFIFNTLSSIMPLCTMDGEKAYEMLSNFSDYLRGRLYKKGMDTEIPLYRELDLIDAYIEIEKMRFPDLIHYSVAGDYDENWTMIPLVLEPFVENAVQHGRKPKEVLEVRVGIWREGDFIRLSVEDNGCGMDEQRLLELKQGDSSTQDSIGIFNVRRRMMLYYNEPIEIESVLNRGTRVSFRIPMKK